MTCNVNNFYYDVSAVLITYNPDLEILCTVIDAISKQVSKIFIVDNASLNFSEKWPEEFKSQIPAKLHLLHQKENLGIAAAQNIGIEQAMKLGADFVWLLDQDSIPSSSMVAELLAVITSVQSKHETIPVAAVGPAIIDRHTGKNYYFMTERKGRPYKWTPTKVIQEFPPSHEVTVLVASGTLISIEAIKHIGVMRSNYFINHVDTEWCLRAKAMGYKLLGVPTSKLEHRFGDTTKRVWIFGFKEVICHSPLRNYYDIRNTLLMLRSTPMTWIWKAHFIGRLIRLVYFLVFDEERWLRLRYMTLGMFHGAMNISGRLEVKSNRCSVINGSESTKSPNPHKQEG